MKLKMLNFILAVWAMMLVPVVGHADPVLAGYCGDPEVNEGRDVSWRCVPNGLNINQQTTYTLIIEGTGPMVELYQMPFGYNTRPWRDVFDYITRLEVCEGVTHLSGSAMHDSKVETFSLASTVKTIGQSAFYGCNNLTSVDIPGTVETIGVSAFSNCKNLEEITLHRGLKSIGRSAFSQHPNDNNTKLKSITIPNTVTEIGDGAFAYCTGLTDITLEEGLTVFGGFRRIGATEVVIPSSVTTINQAALVNCPNLKKIVIGEGVTSIGLDAFDDNINVEIIICLPTTVPEGHRPLYEFQNRENFVLVVPAEAYDAYYEAWSDVRYNTVIGGLCGDLTWTYNPSTKALSLIGDGAMPDFDQIEEVPWYSYSQEIASLSIGSGVTYVSKSAFRGYPQLITIEVETGNATYSAENNCLVRTENATLVMGCNGSTIPASVLAIESGAFHGCAGLSTITIPAGVNSIDEGAFRGCPLTAIAVEEGNTVYQSVGNCLIETETNTLVLGCINSEIPEIVTSIGSYAFAECPGLTAISIPANVNTVGNYAFADCATLAIVTAYATRTPGVSDNTFQGISEEAVLYHPAGSDYSTWAPYFKELKYIAKETETITDGITESYDNQFDMPVNTLTYVRNLPNLHWNPLYVPFEIPYDAIEGNYEAAYINAVHSYDKDDDGTIDELAMEVVKIKTGTLKANYPYLLKARNEAASSMTLSMEDAILYAAEEKTVNCSSVYQTFEITGSYSRRTAEALSGKLAISTTGAWQTLAEGTYLNPFRLYLSISNRDDSPLKVSEAALSRVKIIENGETTGIISLTPDVSRELRIFDINGRCVMTPQKGHPYIINGKKVVY